MMMKEIEGYEGLYSVTIDGRVWSHKRKNRLKGKWLKPRKDKDGYMIISLCKDGKTKDKKIHRLIGQAYILNPENKPQINHLSGIKTDNRISNLNWTTNKENHTHARKIGLLDNLDNSGENHGNSKLTQKQVDEIRNNHRKMKYGDKPYEKYNITRTHYYNILINKKWKV